ncbi:MAG: DUF4440 domain-containing protein [Mycetocola sp.]
MSGDIERAWTAETKLLDGSVRTDRNATSALLAPAFYEIGQSGRRLTRDAVLEALANESGDELQGFVIDERTEQIIRPGLVLLSYRLQVGGRTSRRSSLWSTSDHAQLLFHQGTPADRQSGAQ